MKNQNSNLLILGIIIVAGAYYVFTNRGVDTPTINSTQVATGTPMVSIENYAFNPALLTVKKGATVTWTNNDSVLHTIATDNRDVGLASGTMQKGQTYAYTFNTVGTYVYHCGIHPSMEGGITVIE